MNLKLCQNACHTCQLNCKVARREREHHWANKEGIKPIYNGMEDCPKAKNIDALLEFKEKKDDSKNRRTRKKITGINGNKQRI